MFTLHDQMISPHKARLEAVRRILPQVHHQALEAGILHLHSRVSAAAEDAGIDPGLVQVGWNRGSPFLGIASGEAGDRLADLEYGTDREPPDPVLRTSLSSARRAAENVYRSHVRRSLGI